MEEVITKERETNVEIFNVENVTNQNNNNDDDDDTKFNELINFETSTKNLSIITTLITEENQKTTSANTNTPMEEISSSENEKNIDLSIITTDTSLYNSSTFIFNFTENNTPTLITEKYQKTTDMIETTSTDTNDPMEEVSSNEDERNITNISEYIASSTISTTIKNNFIDDDYTTIDTDIIDSTTDSLFNNETCTSGECKNLASKILFYMNHTIDPCEDFYEYACGGFEINPQTVELDLEDISYQRILSAYFIIKKHLFTIKQY